MLDSPYTYEDNPNILGYLRSLTKEQFEHFVKGYVLACTQTRDLFTRTRLEFLKVLLETNSGSSVARSNVHLLDYLESSILHKEEHLKRYDSGA